MGAQSPKDVFALLSSVEGQCPLQPPVVSSNPRTGLGAASGCVGYLLPLARLCVWQSIVRFDRSVAPPFDQAVTWSASISSWA